MNRLVRDLAFIGLSMGALAFCGCRHPEHTQTSSASQDVSTETLQQIEAILASRATSLTLERLAAARELVRGKAQLDSLDFGYYPISQIIPAGPVLTDEWGRELDVWKDTGEIYVVSAGRDGVFDDVDDVMKIVDLTEYGKACRQYHGRLSSPAARQKIIDAFHRTVGNRKGYEITVTEEKGIQVYVGPPEDKPESTPLP